MPGIIEKLQTATRQVLIKVLARYMHQLAIQITTEQYLDQLISSFRLPTRVFACFMIFAERKYVLPANASAAANPSQSDDTSHCQTCDARRAVVVDQRTAVKRSSRAVASGTHVGRPVTKKRFC